MDGAPPGGSLAERHPQGGDPRHDLGAQLDGGLLAGARALDQGLERLVEVVLLQARPTRVEVVLDLHGVVDGHLAVEVLVDPVQDLRAVRVGSLALAAAHESAPWVAKPRSAAYSVSSSRNWRR